MSRYSNTVEGVAPEAVLEHLTQWAHNGISPSTRGVPLDLQRLLELEKLAGLRLDSLQREKMLADLIQLEEFASNLPELSHGNTDDDAPVDPQPGESSC